jgi:hypothetical protein
VNILYYVHINIAVMILYYVYINVVVNVSAHFDLQIGLLYLPVTRFASWYGQGSKPAVLT